MYYTSNWPSKEGLRIGHLNVCHIINKVDDILSILNNNGHPFHVFGITESHLNDLISDNELNIPGYNFVRKDGKTKLKNGIIVYISNSLQFSRKQDLEDHGVESIWIEIKLKNISPIPIGFVYKNPKELVNWNLNLNSMLEQATILYNEIIILGDFNIDLLKNQQKWMNNIQHFNLNQVIKSVTRPAAKTLIDHIYVTNKSHISEVSVPVLNLSDHYPICLTWSRKGIKIPKAGHKTITYRSFSKFKESMFLNELNKAGLETVYSFTDPNLALERWLKIFIMVYNKHAPIKTKRVKYFSKPKYWDDELERAANLRDELLSKGKKEESNKQRNKVTSMKRRKRKEYLKTL